jgi:hypothetical protein
LCEAWEYLRRDDLSSAEWDTLQRKTFYGQEKKSLAYVLGVMNMILHGFETPTDASDIGSTLEWRHRAELGLTDCGLGARAAAKASGVGATFRRATRLSGCDKPGASMPQPPPSGPHSDIDGVHQDGASNLERTKKAARDPADLKLQRAYGKGYRNDVEEENTPPAAKEEN